MTTSSSSYDTDSLFKDLQCVCGDWFSPEEPAEHQPVAARQCGHSFHRGCVTNWKEKGECHVQKKNFDCPYCRAQKAFVVDDLYLNYSLCHALKALQERKENQQKNKDKTSNTDGDTGTDGDTDNMDTSFEKCSECNKPYSTADNENDELSPILGRCGCTFCRSCIKTHHLCQMLARDQSNLKNISCMNGKCKAKCAFHIEKLHRNFSLCAALLTWRQYFNEYVQQLENESEDPSLAYAMERQKRHEAQKPIKEEEEQQQHLQDSSAPSTSTSHPANTSSSRSSRTSNIEAAVVQNESTGTRKRRRIKEDDDEEDEVDDDAEEETEESDLGSRAAAEPTSNDNQQTMGVKEESTSSSPVSTNDANQATGVKEESLPSSPPLSEAPPPAIGIKKEERYSSSAPPLSKGSPPPSLHAEANSDPAQVSDSTCNSVEQDAHENEAAKSTAKREKKDRHSSEASSPPSLQPEETFNTAQNSDGTFRSEKEEAREGETTQPQSTSSSKKERHRSASQRRTNKKQSPSGRDENNDRNSRGKNEGGRFASGPANKDHSASSRKGKKQQEIVAKDTEQVPTGARASPSPNHAVRNKAGRASDHDVPGKYRRSKKMAPPVNDRARQDVFWIPKKAPEGSFNISAPDRAREEECKPKKRTPSTSTETPTTPVDRNGRKRTVAAIMESARKRAALTLAQNSEETKQLPSKGSGPQAHQASRTSESSSSRQNSSRNNHDELRPPRKRKQQQSVNGPPDSKSAKNDGGKRLSHLLSSSGPNSSGSYHNAQATSKKADGNNNAQVAFTSAAINEDILEVHRPLVPMQQNVADGNANDEQKTDDSSRSRYEEPARADPEEPINLLDDNSDDEIKAWKPPPPPIDLSAMPPGVNSLVCTNPDSRLEDMIIRNESAKYLCMDEYAENREWKVTFGYMGHTFYCILSDSYLRQNMVEDSYERMVEFSLSKAFWKLRYNSQSKDWTVLRKSRHTTVMHDDDANRLFRPEFLETVKAASKAGPGSFRNIKPWCRLVPPVVGIVPNHLISNEALKFQSRDQRMKNSLVCAFASAVYSMGKHTEATSVYNQGVNLPRGCHEFENLAGLVTKHLEGYKLQKQVQDQRLYNINIDDRMPLVFHPKLASSHLRYSITVYKGMIFEPTLENPVNYKPALKETIDIFCGGSGEFTGIDEIWKLVEVVPLPGSSSGI